MSESGKLRVASSEARSVEGCAAINHDCHGVGTDRANFQKQVAFHRVHRMGFLSLAKNFEGNPDLDGNQVIPITVLTFSLTRG